MLFQYDISGMGNFCQREGLKNLSWFSKEKFRKTANDLLAHLKLKIPAFFEINLLKSESHRVNPLFGDVLPFLKEKTFF